MFSWLKERRRTLALITAVTSAIYKRNEGFEIATTYKSANSMRFRITSSNPRDDGFIIKVTRSQMIQGHFDPGTVALPSISMRFQEGFRKQLPPWLVVPEVVQVDDAEGVMAMRYVEGTDLKSLLSQPQRPSDFDPGFVAEQAGRALARWHEFGKASGEPATESSSKGGPSFRVFSFLDYSVWNIRVRPDMRTIALLDFPGAKVMDLRHRDLASFLHSLLVVRHHPLNRIKGLRWWGWQETYASFLQGYRGESGYGLTDLDFKLLADNLATAIRRESAQYKRLRLNPSKSAEGAWYSLLKRHPALRPEALSALFSNSRREA